MLTHAPYGRIFSGIKIELILSCFNLTGCQPPDRNRVLKVLEDSLYFTSLKTSFPNFYINFYKI
jgi:hypothetical protein